MARGALIWIGLAAVIVVPFVAAALSPQLQWREPIYIVAGFAGIIAMALMVLQPLLAGGVLPGFDALRGRRFHGMIGGLIGAAVVLHVFGLWITSPPDVIDALLLVSPTPFSLWGVIALWATMISAFVAIFRKRFGLRVRTWRILHTGLVLLIVPGTIAHVLLIDGTMEWYSKLALCVVLALVTAKIIFDLGVWKFLVKRSR